MKYKIAFIVKLFPKLSETFILNQITDLIEKGHDVLVYSFGTGDVHKIHQSFIDFGLATKTNYYRPFPKNKVRRALSVALFALKNSTTISKYQTRSGFKRKIHEVHFDLQLADFLVGGKFDIVHAHFGQRGAVVANLIERGWIGHTFGFVTSFHGYDLTPSELNEYGNKYRSLVKHSDALTVNSQYLEELLIKVFPTPGKLVRMPESLKIHQYRRVAPHNVNVDTFTILFIGRFVEFKAPDLAVEIVAKLIASHVGKRVQLKMIGSGKLFDKVLTLIRDKKLESHIFLLGSMTQDEVIREIEHANLFLLPGVYERETGRAEAQGLVVQEAQAMELPVIVSDAGGTKYGLSDGESGFVVKAGDVDAFADKIKLLIESPGLAVKMGKAGRDFVRERFDTARLGESLVRLYDSIKKQNQ